MPFPIPLHILSRGSLSSPANEDHRPSPKRSRNQLSSALSTIVLTRSCILSGRYDVKRAFDDALTNAEIEDFRFHDLRHTFASYLVMNGVDIKTVQELLGHASLTMTMKYAHLAPDHRARAIKILDTAYQSDTKTDTVENSGNGQST